MLNTPSDHEANIIIQHHHDPVYWQSYICEALGPSPVEAAPNAA